MCGCSPEYSERWNPAAGFPGAWQGGSYWCTENFHCLDLGLEFQICSCGSRRTGDDRSDQHCHPPEWR